MNADRVDDGSETVTLNVEVPPKLLEEIDRVADDLGYPSRSEFVRAVLQDTTVPILTRGAQEGVAQRYADIAAGRTTSREAVKRRFGLGE